MIIIMIIFTIMIRIYIRELSGVGIYLAHRTHIMPVIPLWKKGLSIFRFNQFNKKWQIDGGIKIYKSCKRKEWTISILNLRILNVGPGNEFSRSFLLKNKLT
jgi:hypothetical protein